MPAKRMTEVSKKWSSSGINLDSAEAEARRLEKKGTFAATMDEEAGTVTLSKDDFKSVMGKLGTHKRTAKTAKKNVLLLAFGYLAVTIGFIAVIVGLVNWRLEATKESHVVGSTMVSNDNTVVEVKDVESYTQLFDIPYFNMRTINKLKDVVVSLHDGRQVAFSVSRAVKSAGSTRLQLEDARGNFLEIDSCGMIALLKMDGIWHAIGSPEDSRKLSSAAPRLYSASEYSSLLVEQRALGSNTGTSGTAVFALQAAEAMLDMEEGIHQPRDWETAYIQSETFIVTPKSSIVAHYDGEVFAERTDGEIHYRVHMNNGPMEAFIDTSKEWIYQRITPTNGGMTSTSCFPLTQVESQIQFFTESKYIEVPTLRDCNEDGYSYSNGDSVTRTMVVDFNTAHDGMIVFPDFAECAFSTFYDEDTKWGQNNASYDSSDDTTVECELEDGDCEMPIGFQDAWLDGMDHEEEARRGDTRNLKGRKAPLRSRGPTVKATRVPRNPLSPTVAQTKRTLATKGHPYHRPDVVPLGKPKANSCSLPQGGKGGKKSMKRGAAIRRLDPVTDDDGATGNVDDLETCTYYLWNAQLGQDYDSIYTGAWNGGTVNWGDGSIYTNWHDQLIHVAACIYEKLSTTTCGTNDTGFRDITPNTWDCWAACQNGGKKGGFVYSFPWMVVAFSGTSHNNGSGTFAWVSNGINVLGDLISAINQLPCVYGEPASAQHHGTVLAVNAIDGCLGMYRDRLSEEGIPVSYAVGHSLGGAMATVYNTYEPVSKMLVTFEAYPTCFSLTEYVLSKIPVVLDELIDALLEWREYVNEELGGGACTKTGYRYAHEWDSITGGGAVTWAVWLFMRHGARELMRIHPVCGWEIDTFSSWVIAAFTGAIITGIGNFLISLANMVIGWADGICDTNITLFQNVLDWFGLQDCEVDDIPPMEYDPYDWCSHYTQNKGIGHTTTKYGGWNNNDDDDHPNSHFYDKLINFTGVAGMILGVAPILGSAKFILTLISIAVDFFQFIKFHSLGSNIYAKRNVDDYEEDYTPPTPSGPPNTPYYGGWGGGFFNGNSPGGNIKFGGDSLADDCTGVWCSEDLWGGGGSPWS